MIVYIGTGPTNLAAGSANATSFERFAVVQRVSDAELAKMRGGILLAGGLEVAIGVAIETRIDGQLALRSQLTSAVTGVQLYAGGAPTMIVGTVAAAGGTVAAPTAQVVADRAATGTLVTVYPSVSVSPVSIGPSAAWASGPSAASLPVASGGPGVATAFGTVTLMPNGNGSVAELVGSGLDVRQFIGAATGVSVANTVNNRVIDTMTSVNIDLSGVVIPANLTSTLGAIARGVGLRTSY